MISALLCYADLAMNGCVLVGEKRAQMALQWLLFLLLIWPAMAQTNDSWREDEDYVEYLDDTIVLLEGNGTLLNETATNRTRTRYKALRPAYGVGDGDADPDWDLMPVIALCVVVGLATVVVGSLMGCFCTSERRDAKHQATIDKLTLDDNDMELVYDDDFTLAPSATQLSSTAISSATDNTQPITKKTSTRYKLPQVHQRPPDTDQLPV